jgi:hypothetical protein
VLGGVPAAKYRYARLTHFVEVEVEVVVDDVDGEVVVLVDVVGLVNWPTTIRTVLPFFAIRPPRGDWLTTIPFRAGLLTAWLVRETLNPAPVSAPVAAVAVWP